MPDSSWAKDLKNIYETWNIRGAVLLSLSLQIILIVIAPFRKRTGKRLVHLVIWLAYLLADAAAIFAVGLIFRTEKNAATAATDHHPAPAGLLAFWAPFLLLHLGGPDTITALALEDNELWIRHFFTFITQGIPTGYVFVRTRLKNKVWLPTLLLFIAAIIKYLERTCSLFLASTDKFRNSVLRDPDPGPSYAKLMGEYAPADKVSSGPSKGASAGQKNSRKEGSGPEDNARADEVSSGPPKGAASGRKDSEDNVETIRMAYEYFDTFKALIVDLNLSFKELDKSREFFNSLNAEDALNVLQVELNFMYESLFTKATVVHSNVGKTLRLVAFFSVVAAFIIFAVQERMSHISDSVDIRVTYTLLWGAIGLDLLSFLMAMSSDWTVASLEKSQGYKSWGEKFLDKVRDWIGPLLKRFISGKQARWCSRETCSTDGTPKFEVLDTSFFLGRWSGSIICHSLISYGLQGRSKRIFKSRNKLSEILHQSNNFFNNQFFRIICLLRIDKLGTPDLVEEVRYVAEEPFPKELWEFIFGELKEKSKNADNPESAKRIYSARGDWVLDQDETCYNWDGLVPYILDVEYDESLLLWHIATELLYYTEENEKDESHDPDDVRIARIKARIFSKILSSYMFYLLSFQSRMLAAVAGMDKLTLQDTYANAKKFFESKGLKADEEKKACRKILNASIEPSAGGLDDWRSKSVLFKAGNLANELQKLEGEKWKVLSKIWVELLSYAATHCRPYNQVQLLGKGGGLISIVWLLMAHFGVSQQFKYK